MVGRIHPAIRIGIFVPGSADGSILVEDGEEYSRFSELRCDADT